MEKEQLRQQALRQKQLEVLYDRHAELNNELGTLQSNNPNKRAYIVFSALFGACVYCELLIFMVSLLFSGSLELMFGALLGWTIFFAIAAIVLYFPLRKTRQAHKALMAQVRACQDRIADITNEIIALQNQ